MDFRFTFLIALQSTFYVPQHTVRFCHACCCIAGFSLSNAIVPAILLAKSTYFAITFLGALVSVRDTGRFVNVKRALGIKSLTISPALSVKTFRDKRVAIRVAFTPILCTIWFREDKLAFLVLDSTIVPTDLIVWKLAHYNTKK